MDIRQLKFFLAVVDHNGFSRAAAHLLVAQPSLSQAIASFERELGMPLFHRIGRGVVLSEAGSALVGPARVVLRDLDEAKAIMCPWCISSARRRRTPRVRDGWCITRWATATSSISCG